MSSRFEALTTPILEMTVLVRNPVGDGRGYLERLFCEEELSALLAGRKIVQINHTYTASKGIIRGMHFQIPPHAEMKLVTCLRGEVFDVAVDLRPDSPSYQHWHAELLSAENHRTLLIPEGCAHGFQTLADNCEMVYFHTQAYCAAAEGGVHPLDPSLAIGWPLPVEGLSSRDASHPLLTDIVPGMPT